MGSSLPDNGRPVKLGDPSFIYQGVYNPIQWIGDQPYRPRVETLVIKNSRYLYIKLNTNKDAMDRIASGHDATYELPGGSLDVDSDKIHQAENEVNEEILVTITNIYDTGIQYFETFTDDNVEKYAKMFPLSYRGFITNVYCAEYIGKYNAKKVEEKDLDPEMQKSQCLPITSVANILTSDHINALLGCPFVDEKIKSTLRLYLVRKGSETSTNVDNSNNMITEAFPGKLFKRSPKTTGYEYIKQYETMLINKVKDIVKTHYRNNKAIHVYSDKQASLGEIWINIFDGDQEERIKYSNIVSGIKRLLSQDNEVKKIEGLQEITTGDGDEGCIYVKFNKIKKVNSIHSTTSGDSVLEACKNINDARKFCSEVDKLAKKYDANYFLVTDGASKIHNNGNPAVKNARDKQIEWENSHGFDSDEDWGTGVNLCENSSDRGFKEVNSIVKTLSPKEKSNICNGVFKNSPYVIYREISTDKKSFIDVYRFESDPTTGIIVVASSPRGRGSGNIQKLVNHAVNSMGKYGVSKLVWKTQPDNKASHHIAEKCGFVQNVELSNTHEVIYELNVPNTMITENIIPNKYLDVNQGFYNDGIWNSAFVYKGKTYRYRVETIIFDKEGKIFAYINNKGVIKLPGGSTEPNTSPLDQAINEIHEEAKLEVQNVEKTNISYIKPTGRIIPKYQQELPVKYDGVYCEVYTATAIGKYNGAIDIVDRDNDMANRGRFYEPNILLKNGSSQAINMYIARTNESFLPLTTNSNNSLSGYSIIDENIIIPKKDITFNMDKWKPGTPLWIISGSDEYGHNLAYKYTNMNSNVSVVSTGNLSTRICTNGVNNYKQLKSYLKSQGQIMYMVDDYVKQHPNLPGNISVWDIDSQIKYFNDFFKWVIKNAKSNSKYNKDLIIVEGARTICNADVDLIKDQPLMILGTSRLQSLIHRAKTSTNVYNSSFIPELLIQLKNYYKYYKPEDDEKDKFTRQIKNTVTESFATEAGVSDELVLLNRFNSPKELQQWMHRNIKYKHTNKFQDYPDMIERGSGDCHDQAYYEYEWLRYHNYDCGRIFMVEYYDYNKPGGATHTVTWYKDKNKIYWIENAWEDEAGIHGPYDSIEELQLDIVSRWPWSGKNDKLYMNPVSRIAPGVTFQDYVEACTPVKTPTNYYIRDDEIQESFLPLTTNSNNSLSEYSIIDENIIIPQDNLEFNLEKWGPGTPLWITGSPGDGKSTLAAEYANQNNAILVSTDSLLVRICDGIDRYEKSKTSGRIHGTVSNDIDMADDYITNHPELPEGLSKWNPDSVASYFNDFFKWIINSAKKNPKYNKYMIIVEGCDVCSINSDLIKGQPLIIMGTSRLQSLIRRSKRNANNNDTLVITELFKQIKKYNRTMRTMDNHKDRFIHQINESILQETSLLLETKRSELPDSVFGVPEQRKYPLDTEEHVRSAIKLFNHVDPKYEAGLAKAIKQKMKEYSITDIHIGEKNRLSKYVTESVLPLLESKSQYNAVYVVSVHYNSTFGKIVRAYTNSNFNHSAIALSKDLSKMYTFIRERTNTGATTNGGFSIETVDILLDKDPNMYAKIVKIPVDIGKYKALKEKLEHYERFGNTSYDFGVIPRSLFKMTANNDDIDETSMACSTFVAYCLDYVGIDLPKPVENMTPEDVSNIPGKIVYEGEVKKLKQHPITESITKPKKKKPYRYKSFTETELNDAADKLSKSDNKLLKDTGHKLKAYLKTESVSDLNILLGSISAILIFGGLILDSNIAVILVGIILGISALVPYELIANSLLQQKKVIRMQMRASNKFVSDYFDAVDLVVHSAGDVSVIESVNVILEAEKDDEDEDEPLDYTEAADGDDTEDDGDDTEDDADGDDTTDDTEDDDTEGDAEDGDDTEDEPLDYTEAADGDDTEDDNKDDTEGDDTEDGDDTTDDTEGDDTEGEAADGDDTEDEPLDYTEAADGDDTEDDADGDDTENDAEGDDTTDDTEGDDTEGDTEDGDDTGENEEDTQNTIVKNYNLILDFQNLYRLLENISKSLESTVFKSPVQNVVLAQIINNVKHIKDSVSNYIEFNFKSDYTTNLYNYQIFIKALNMSLEMLKSTKDLYTEDQTSK